MSNLQCSTFINVQPSMLQACKGGKRCYGMHWGAKRC